MPHTLEYLRRPPFRGPAVKRALQELRRRHGWSQETLAAQLGVTRRHIIRVENGHEAIGPLVLLRLAWLSRVLGHTDLAQFFGRLLRRMLWGAPGGRAGLLAGGGLEGPGGPDGGPGGSPGIDITERS